MKKKTYSKVISLVFLVSAVLFQAQASEPFGLENTQKAAYKAMVHTCGRSKATPDEVLANIKELKKSLNQKEVFEKEDTAYLFETPEDFKAALDTLKKSAEAIETNLKAKKKSEAHEQLEELCEAIYLIHSENHIFSPMDQVYILDSQAHAIMHEAKHLLLTGDECSSKMKKKKEVHVTPAQWKIMKVRCIRFQASLPVCKDIFSDKALIDLDKSVTKALQSIEKKNINSFFFNMLNLRKKLLEPASIEYIQGS